MRQLKYFLAVVDAGTFTLAAERLHMAQPPLSTQIRALEEALGVVLFERSRSGVKLTPDGRVFEQEARLLYASFCELPRRMQRLRMGERGLLRVAVIPTAMTTSVAEALRGYREAHAQIVIQIQEYDVEGSMIALLSDEVDIVIGRRPERTRGLEVIPLMRQRQALLCPENHRLAGQGHLTWKKLEGQHILLLKGNSHFGALLKQICVEKNLKVEFEHLAHDTHSLLWHVATGAGLCPVIAEVASPLPSGVKLLTLPADGPTVPLDMMHRTEPIHSGTRQLVEFIRESFRGGGN